MNKIIILLKNYPLQFIFGSVMFFILVALLWGFFYISQPEYTRRPEKAAPTPLIQKTHPNSPTPTIAINHNRDFTQEELLFPTMSAEPGSDYSHAGGIAVTSNPSEATITFTTEGEDEQTIASYKTPFRTTGLMVGPYTLTATKPGFETRTLTTTVTEGEIISIEIDLKPL